MSAPIDSHDDAPPQGRAKLVLGVIGALMAPVIFFTAYTIFIVVVAAASAQSGAAPGSGSASCSAGQSDLRELRVEMPDGKFRTLGETELRHAATIIAVARSLGVPPRAEQIAIMTALQESGLKMYANSTVPESLNYDHDAVGEDHDSVNYFQQRPASGWGTVAELMDPVYAAKAFFGGESGPNGGSPRGLLDVKGWESMDLGEAAQTVQVSAYPSAYDKWEAPAAAIITAVSGSVTCDETAAAGGTAVLPLGSGYQMTSGYGTREIDVPGAPSWHVAVDLQRWPNPCGDPVYASLPGKVTLSSSLWLSIKHPDGFVVSYLHMYKSERLVDVGDTVTAGQQIGVVGNVPPSSGCHLDIRINKNGTTNEAVAALQEATELGAPSQYAGYVDPEEFFRLYGVEICPAATCRRP